MKEQTIKSIGLFFTILVVLDLVLFISNKIKPMLFWIIIVICAIVAYKVLPGLKK